MGLLQKLLTPPWAGGGSPYSTNNGGQEFTIPGGPFANFLITNMSGLHADFMGNNGWSIDGSVYSYNNVILNYTNYNDGVTNPLPTPSTLDLNGAIPSISGHGNNTPGASTQALPYMNNISSNP